MKKPLKKHIDLVDQINAIYQVGDKIKVLQDDGSISEWTVRAPASMLGTHSPVIWANECVGCYAAERLLFQMYLGRCVLHMVEFNGSIEGVDRFTNKYAAERWCKENGYSVGNSCVMSPTALMIGDFGWIAKWKNLNKTERKTVDGVMVGSNKAGGYVVYIFKKSELLTTKNNTDAIDGTDKK